MKLNFRSNDVCFLLGAGASRHANVPTMLEMWERLFNTWQLADFRKRIDELRSRDDRNIEALLKYLHQSTPDHPSPYAVGNSDTALTNALLTRADTIIEFEIRKFVLHQVDQHIYRREYDTLSEWIPIDGPLDIFSLNYDLVIEDFCSRNRVPLHDGFDANGNWAPVSWSLATKGIRLWKLHGSINWKVDRKTGLLTRTYTPRTLASVIHASHSASPTAEVELIWPAVYKEFEGSLAVMQHAFVEKVRRCRVLVIVGYRCADPGVISAMKAAFASNSCVRIFIACGSSGDEVKAKIASEIAPELADRATIVRCEGGRFPQVLRSLDFANEVSAALAGERSSTAPLAVQSQNMHELICPGKFTAICRLDRQLYLAGLDTKASLYHFDSARQSLTRLKSWFGWPRELAGTTIGQLLVADCRYSSATSILPSRFREKVSKQGVGCLRIFDLQTARFRIAGYNRLALFWVLLDILKAFRKGMFFSFRQFSLIRAGILSWPTSVLDHGIPNEYIVVEARNLTTYSLRYNIFRRITGPRFFNLIGIQPWHGRCVLLLEAVLDNVGSVWKYNVETGDSDLLVSGIEAPGGIVSVPTKNCAYLSTNREHGKLYRLDVAGRTLNEMPIELRYPSKMLEYDDDSLLVLTRDALVRVQLSSNRS